MDLAFVETESLVRELMGRYDHAVFAGIKAGYHAPTDNLTTRRWKGNLVTCAGLGYQLAHLTTEEHLDTGKPVKE